MPSPRQLMPTVASLVLIAFGCLCQPLAQANPVQPPFNQTCITEKTENGTTVTIISSSMVTNNVSDPSQQSPIAQFNERRRDMHFEDYNITQVQVIDTSVISNRTIIDNGHERRPGPSQTAPPVSVAPSTRPPLPPPTPAPATTMMTNEIFNGNHIPDDVSQYITPNILPQRPNVLAPKLEGTGRPACVQSPDDTFCEMVDNYPNKSAIRTEIDFSPQQFNDIFGSKEIDGRSRPDPGDNDEESVCRKVPRVIYPQMAKNQANQWVYVVNEVEYTQAVVAEICEKPGKPCTHLENLPMGMYSRCKQKYSYKRLLALHPTEKRTYPDAFKFPSCCSCYIKYDDYLGRSNFRKLEAKVDITPANSAQSQGRDSRVLGSESVLTAPTNETVLTVDNVKTAAVHHSSDNTTIEIMSQQQSALGEQNTTKSSADVPVAKVEPLVGQ